MRIIALFLLVYSFGDIVFPQYCCEEVIGLYSTGTSKSCIQSTKDASAQQTIISLPSDEKQKSGAIPGDEDCFCRSSVLPSPSQSARLAAAAEIAPPTINPDDGLLQSLQLSGASTAIHSPPRFSKPPQHLSQIIRC